jgi:site-specific recombinase XerD
MANDLTVTRTNELAEVSAEGRTLVVDRRLDRNPAAVYLASLRSEHSRRTMRQALATIAEYLTGSPDLWACPWESLRFQHTAAIGAYLAGKYAPATTNKMLSALRGALQAAWQLDLMTAEEYHKARKVQGVIGSTLPAGRGMTAGEISALMAACEADSSPAGARDGAIIALMYSCGLRRAELAALDLENYDRETGALVVLGKRQKERFSYLAGGAAMAMADWLRVRGDESGALFWPIGKAGRLTNKRLTTQAVYRILHKRGSQAGVKPFSPHDLRRTFVSDLLDAGADIVTVQKLAGHSSAETTARYDRRGEAVKRKAVGLLHVPYRGR